MINLRSITGFNWDDGNARKNEKHGVSMAEAEQVFFNAPLLLLEDSAHSQQEPRLHALGKTDDVNKYSELIKRIKAAYLKEYL
ncbi:MAG: hypothetical protein RJB10_527, partial [Pseudomonadota bacterium]